MTRLELHLRRLALLTLAACSLPILAHSPATLRRVLAELDRLERDLKGSR
jgi:hypothetical protein